MSQDIELYDYRPITEREPLSWPGGKRVAFYASLNIEHFYVDLPGTATYEGTTALTPDSLNHGWRDYGPRVGIWRLLFVDTDQAAGQARRESQCPAELRCRRVALALHPFVTGQAFRARYLDEASAYVVNHPGVWTTTADAIGRPLPGGDGAGSGVAVRRMRPPHALGRPICRDPI